MMDATDDALISLSQAAHILGVSTERVRRLVQLGYLAEVARRALAPSQPPAILVRRSEVERLALMGWPGRITRLRARDAASGSQPSSGDPRFESRDDHSSGSDEGRTS